MIAAAPAVHRFEAEAMGSPLRAIVVGLDAADSAEVWASIAADVEASEQAMSRFRSDSEVTRLNTAAGGGREGVPVSPRLYEALATSRRAWRRTAGLFDPRVIADLERLGYRGASWDGRIDAPEPGSRPTRPWLDVTPRRREVTLHEPVDLGGIGKGLALRWAAARARTGHQPPAGLLIEAGGDLITAGEPPDGRPTWTIGIEDPTAPGTHVAIVAAPAGAVCTSSPTVINWTRPDGTPAHHLIDPRTGEPAASGLLSVTVARTDPAWAEVWSKTLFLVGEGDAAAVGRHHALAAWWVEADGALSMTPAARALTLWTAR